MGKGMYIGVQADYANYTLTNMVTNSSFLNGGTVSTSQQYGGINSGYMTYPTNHKVYMRMKITTTSGTPNGMIIFYDSYSNFITQSSQSEDGKGYVSLISMNDTATRVQVGVQNFTTNLMQCSYSECVFVDLTACFGAGKEPDTAWCDKNIPFFTGTNTFEIALEKNELLPKEVKKMYLNVDGKAKKVIKAYLNVNGIAKLFFSANSTVVYHGRLTNTLSESKQYLASASVGSYALFAGGYNGGGRSTVDAFDKYLVKSTPTSLSDGRYNLAGASIGDYALFGFGTTSSAAYTTVDAYSKDLTKSNAPQGTVGRYELASASTNNHAIFAGGYNNGGRKEVDAYDRNLVRTTPTELSVGRYDLVGAKVGDYALFAGGHDTSGYSSVVDAYDHNLTRSNPTSLSVSRQYLAGATVGKYALFAGGYNGDYTSAVDAYDKSLTRTLAPNLSSARCHLASANLDDYALFAGGVRSSYSSVVNMYDNSLTMSTLSSLSYARYGLAGATVGNYALFAGGHDTSGYYSSTVDAYRCDYN